MYHHPALLAAAVGLSFLPVSSTLAQWRSGYVRDQQFTFCMSPCTIYALESEVEGESGYIAPMDGEFLDLQPYVDQHVLIAGVEDFCFPFCTSFYIYEIWPLPDIVPLASIQDLVLVRHGSGFSLHWTAPPTDVNGNPDVDVEGYRVHGSREPWFEPMAENLLGTTTDTLWTLSWPGVNEPRWFRVVALGQTRIELP